MQTPSTVAQVAEATNLRHINVGDWVKEQDLHSGYDAEFDSYIIDEDKVRIRARCRHDQHTASTLEQGPPLCSLALLSARIWTNACMPLYKLMSG